MTTRNAWFTAFLRTRFASRQEGGRSFIFLDSADEDLMPIMQAAGAKMDFVNYDFWATRTPVTHRHYYELPDFANGQALAGQRTTVWHSVPALHVSRDEDFGPGGVDAERGAALTEWIGFTLRPRNLFDSTPLYP